MLLFTFVAILLVRNRCPVFAYPVLGSWEDPCAGMNCHGIASYDSPSDTRYQTNLKNRGDGPTAWTNSIPDDFACRSESPRCTEYVAGWDETVTENIQRDTKGLSHENLAKPLRSHVLRRDGPINDSVSTPPQAKLRAFQGCVLPNADIAGIGVRTSIYAQTMLSFVPAFLSIRDGFLDSTEERLLHAIYTNLLLTACALLLSAFIQKATFGLSIYHALIVLNLSWMVNATSIVVCVFQTVHWKSKESFPEWVKRLFPAKTRQLTPVFLVILHFCLMAGLGIWVWSTVDAPGNQLTPKGFTTILFKDVLLTNRALRIVSLVLYSVAALPGVNMATFAALNYSVSLAALIVWCKFKGVAHVFGPSTYTYRSIYKAIVLVQTFTNILFIASIELTIHRSKSVPIVCVGIGDSESNWTFGQTLAVAVVICPLCETVKSLLTEIRKTKWGKRVISGMLWWLRGRLRRSRKDWQKYHHDTTEKLHHARLAFDRRPKEPSLDSLNKPILHALDTADAAISIAYEALKASSSSPAATSATATSPLRNRRQLLPGLHYDTQTRRLAKRCYDEIRRYVIGAHEDLGLAYSLRFKECDEARARFFASRACIEAAIEALDATKASLEAADCALEFEVELEEEEETRQFKLRGGGLSNSRCNIM